MYGSKFKAKSRFSDLVEAHVDPEHAANIKEHGKTRIFTALFDVLQSRWRNIQFFSSFFLGEIQLLASLLNPIRDPIKIDLNFPPVSRR